MRILIACEASGRVRDAFIARGHNAISCDILPTEVPGPHVQGDVSGLLQEPWDLVIAFPPCTDLSSVNAHRLKIKAVDGRTDAAEAFFMDCYWANAPRVCVENPAGVMSTRFRKPDQYVQPWWFGEPWRKRTGLWLRGLPPLVATNPLDPPYGDWHRQAMHRGKDVRAKISAETFRGLAAAMADQWSV